MKTLFIYNPISGMMQIKSHLYNILNIFAKAEYDLTILPTRKKGEAIEYIKKKAQEFELIICSGGDGTLNEVINGLMATGLNEKIPLGYIPAGSTNDYAASLKIPKNMEKAAENIINGQIKEFDLGKLNSRYFTYIAAFGAFTRVSYDTPQDTKNILGHFAYFLEGLKSLTEISAYKLKIEHDKQIIEDSFIYGMVTNTYQVGGLYKLDKKEVELDDGQLEVMLVKEPKNAGEFNEITSYLLGNNINTNMVISFKTKKLHFEFEEEIPWTLDGEYGGSHKSVNITNRKKAVKIIV